MRRILAVVLLSCGIAFPSLAVGNRIQTILPTQTVTTGSPVTITIANLGHTTGYLVVKTENDVATPNMQVTVRIDNPLTDIDLCSLVISTETTTVLLIGAEGIAAGEGIDEVCETPLGREISFVFQIGVPTSFDVTAEMQWLAQ